MLINIFSHHKWQQTQSQLMNNSRKNTVKNAMCNNIWIVKGNFKLRPSGKLIFWAALNSSVELLSVSARHQVLFSVGVKHSKLAFKRTEDLVQATLGEC